MTVDSLRYISRLSLLARLSNNSDIFRLVFSFKDTPLLVVVAACQQQQPCNLTASTAGMVVDATLERGGPRDRCRSSIARSQWPPYSAPTPPRRRRSNDRELNITSSPMPTPNTVVASMTSPTTSSVPANVRHLFSQLTKKLQHHRQQVQRERLPDVEQANCTAVKERKSLRCSDGRRRYTVTSNSGLSGSAAVGLESVKTPMRIVAGKDEQSGRVRRIRSSSSQLSGNAIQSIFFAISVPFLLHIVLLALYTCVGLLSEWQATLQALNPAHSFAHRLRFLVYTSAEALVYDAINILVL